MPKSVKTLVASALLGGLVLAARPAGAATLDYVQVANWIVGAYGDAASGRLSHCAASASYKNGSLLQFAVDRDLRWTMGIVNPAWQFAPGSGNDLFYAIDGSHATTARGTTVDEGQLVIPLDRGAAQLDEFRHGKRIVVFAAGQVANFDLNGAEAALDAVRSCVETHLASERPAGTPARAPAGGARVAELPPSGPTEASRIEAVTVLVDLLSVAGIPRFHFLEPAQIPADLAGYDSIWIAPAIVGGARILPAGPAAEAKRVQETTVASDARQCAAGSFTTERTPGGDRTDPILRFVTRCKIGARVAASYYLVLPRAAGGVYLLAVMSAAGATDAARAAESAIYQSAAKLPRE